MGLIAAKCVQCGADIDVDESREYGYCPHCGTKYITEKVVQNVYNTVNNTLNNTTNIAHATIVTQGEDGSSALREQFEAYIRLNDPDRLLSTAEEMVKKYPQSAESHLCLAYAAARAAQIYYENGLAWLESGECDIFLPQYMRTGVAAGPAVLAERIVDSLLRQKNVSVQSCKRIMDGAARLDPSDSDGRQIDDFFASVPKDANKDEIFACNVIVGAACVCGNDCLLRAREAAENAERVQGGSAEARKRAADAIAAAEGLYDRMEKEIRDGAVAEIQKAGAAENKPAAPGKARKIVATVCMIIAVLAFTILIVSSLL